MVINASLYSNPHYIWCIMFPCYTDSIFRLMLYRWHHLCNGETCRHFFKSFIHVLIIYQRYFTSNLNVSFRLQLFSPIFSEITRDTILGPVWFNFPDQETYMLHTWSRLCNGNMSQYIYNKDYSRPKIRHS